MAYFEIPTKVGGSLATGRKFQLRLYYQIIQNATNSDLKVWVNYYCWDLYLGPVNFTVTVGNNTIKATSPRIKDSKKTRSEKTFWAGHTFKNIGSGNISIRVNCTYLRQLNYSNQIYQGFSFTNSINVPSVKKTLITPTNVVLKVINRSDLKAKRGENAQLTWTSSENSNYYIEYHFDEGNWINYGTTSSKSITFTPSGLRGYEIGKILTFRVQAQSSNAFSSGWAVSSNSITMENTPGYLTDFYSSRTFLRSTDNSVTLFWRGTDPDTNTLNYSLTRNSTTISLNPNQTSIVEQYSNLNLGENEYTLNLIQTEGSNTLSLKIYKNDKPTVSVADKTEEGSLANFKYDIEMTNGAAAVAYNHPKYLRLELRVGQTSSSLLVSYTKRVLVTDVSEPYEFSIDLNSDSDEFASRVPEGYWYQISLTYNDGLEDSNTIELDEAKQKHDFPKWKKPTGVKEYEFTNIPLYTTKDTSGAIITEEIVEYTTQTNEDPDPKKLEDVFFVFDDNIDSSKTYSDLAGRMRRCNCLQNSSKLTFKINGIQNSSELNQIIISQSISGNLNTDNYSEQIILTRGIDSNSFTNSSDSESNCQIKTDPELSYDYLEGTFHFENIPDIDSTQQYVKYRISLINIYGMASKEYAVSNPFITNTAPYFPDSILELSKNLLHITPITESKKESDGVNINLILSEPDYGISGSEPDEAVEIGGVNVFTCDKYSASLFFASDYKEKYSIETFDESEPTNEYEYKLSDFYLSKGMNNEKILVNDVTNLNALLELKFYDQLGEGVTEDKGYIYLTDISTKMKMEQVDNIELRIYAYDTFGKRSSNYASAKISIDFTDDPIFYSNEFRLEDITNNGNNIEKLKNRKMLNIETNTYENQRLMNPGESLKFTFPRAYSVRAEDRKTFLNEIKDSYEEGSKERADIENELNEIGSYISIYRIYYSVNGQDGNYNLLNSYPVGPREGELPEVPDSIIIDGVPSTDYYEENHIIRNYNLNTNIVFGIIAEDASITKERQTPMIYSDIMNSREANASDKYDIIVCRLKEPQIEIDHINFEGITEPTVNSPIKISYTIPDIGGSYKTSYMDYFDERNLERLFTITNSEGQPTGEEVKDGNFLIVLLEYGNKSDLTDGQIIKVMENGLYKTDKRYIPKNVLPAEFFPVSTKTDSSNESEGEENKEYFDELKLDGFDSNKNWYMRLKIYVGNNIHSTYPIMTDESGKTVLLDKDNINGTLYSESEIFVLRSLKPTFGYRNTAIGVNVKEPTHTLRVSASGKEDENKTDVAIFDDGLLFEENSYNGEPRNVVDITNNKIVVVDLLTGHIIRGIIDSGRLL